MCGINGLITGDQQLKRKITAMNALVRHRGPDDEGFVFIDAKTGEHKCYSGTDSIEEIKSSTPNISSADFDRYNLIFGHRRLSIIDLSVNGHEPMSDESGKIWITYNGEIYNYVELKEELKICGHSFRTCTDTEVIIKAYLQWGTDCFSRFNGMWAFAIWDDYKKNLILSRDRFGIKPLYYIKEDNVFAFSSEIKPLALLQGKELEINKSNIPRFLINGNRLNTDSTYIKNIYSLPPSNYLIYNEGKISTVKYYDIKNSGIDLSGETLNSTIDELFTDSIKLRYRSDVKVGTCLSGGFDSSSIVAYSNKFLSIPLETFSAVWDDKSCDESKYIDLINRRYKCNGHKIMPLEEEFEKIFSRLHYHQEIPTEGPGLYPQWYIMQIAKGNVKVLLNGQGGDEVFGGYFFEASYLRSLIADKNYTGMLKNFSKYLSFIRRNSLHTSFNKLMPKAYRSFVHKNISVQYKIFKDDFLKENRIFGLEDGFEPPKKFRNYISNLSYHFISSQTIPALLHYEDRSSMAHSIESRVPFLDYRLVELGLNLEPHHLIKDGVSRPLFRSVVAKYLPEEINSRKDKLGYPTPFSKWIRTGLKNYINSKFQSNNLDIYDYLDREKVLNHIIRRHMSGEQDLGWEIWRLLSLDEFIHLFKHQKYLSF